MMSIQTRNRWQTSRRDFLKGSTALLIGGVLAQEGEEKRALRFGLVTDFHYADCEKRGTRHYRESLGKMKECVSLMNEKKVAFLAELGDLKDQADQPKEKETRAFLKTIEAEFAEFKGPRYHVIGNHDIDSISKEQFLANVENTGIAKDKSYYSFDSKWVHFVVLDANYLADGSDCAPGNCEWTDTHVPKKELEWLRRDLEATKLPVVVLAHQRLDGRGSHFTKNSDEVRKLLEKSGRVLVVFQGHDHRGGHSLIGGIHYYTLKAAVEGSGEENNSYGIVEVRRNGDIVVEGFRKAVNLAMPRNS